MGKGIRGVGVLTMRANVLVKSVDDRKMREGRNIIIA